jgi:hypothetical protein
MSASEHSGTGVPAREFLLPGAGAFLERTGETPVPLVP